MTALALCKGPDFEKGGYGLKNDFGLNGYKITNPQSPFLEGTGLVLNDILPGPIVEDGVAPILKWDALPVRRLMVR